MEIIWSRSAGTVTIGVEDNLLVETELIEHHISAHTLERIGTLNRYLAEKPGGTAGLRGPVGLTGTIRISDGRQSKKIELIIPNHQFRCWSIFHLPDPRFIPFSYQYVNLM
jgi:hypothetical protein